MIDFLTLNAVYERKEKRFRLLEKLGDSCVFIDIDAAKAMPFQIGEDEINHELENQDIVQIEDPWLEVIHRQYDEHHPYIIRKNKNYELIREIVTHPRFYNDKIRGAVVQIILSKNCVAKSTLYRYSRRYWQRGQTANALLPDYKNCGAPGKKKMQKGKPRGRLVKISPVPGEQTSNELESMMHSSIMSTVLSGRYRVDKGGKKKKIHEIGCAYAELLLRYCDGDISKLDERKPSLAMLKSYYYKEYSSERRANAAHGEKYFQANTRLLTSTVRKELIGPGQSYTIDSTPFDVGVANKDRFPLARPTLYCVTDDFSSAIVGVLLILTPPSYFNVVNCMTVAVGSKVDLCQKFGLTISSSEWPMEGLPRAFFADLGSDFKTSNIEALAHYHNVAMKNSGAGQPDKRGGGEKSFDRIHREVRGLVPGVVSQYLSKKAGGQYSQDDYTLVLKELNKILLKAVITLNNKPLEKWDGDADFPSILATTPLNIWKWGIANRTGRLQAVNKEYFWFSMLKQEYATVSTNILKIGEIQFVCLNLSGLRVKNYHPRKKMTVVRDMDDASAIFVVPDEGQSEYIRCELSPEFRRYKGLQWADVKSLLNDRKKANGMGRHEYYKKKVLNLKSAKEVVSNAKQEKNDSMANLSKPAQRRFLGNKVEQRKESQVIYNVVKPDLATEECISKPRAVETTDVSRTQFFMDED